MEELSRQGTYEGVEWASSACRGGQLGCLGFR